MTDLLITTLIISVGANVFLAWLYIARAKIPTPQDNHNVFKQKYTKTYQTLDRVIASLPVGVALANGKLLWSNDKFFSKLPKALKQASIGEHIYKTDTQVFSVHKIAFDGKAFLYVSLDITQSAQMHEAKSTFVANVSHEMRTPLTVIIGFLETLAEDDVDADTRTQFVVLMLEHATRLFSMTDSLLTLSALEMPKGNAHSVNLSNLVLRAIRHAHPKLKTTQALYTDVAPNIHLLADENELYGAVFNLIVNAIYHSGAHSQITVMLDTHTFCVADTGVGIDSADLARLGERFFRVDKSRGRNDGGGSGLGLAIAKQAWARHDCQLSIYSKKGVGSVFLVHLNKATNATPPQSPQSQEASLD